MGTPIIKIKRAYAKPARADGRRVLVDRMWPRGVKKDEARIDEWKKELAPSTELRRWFGHDPEKWPEFKKRYRRELKSQQQSIDDLLEKTRDKTLTLVYAAKDEERNNAVALKEYLESKL